MARGECRGDCNYNRWLEEEGHPLIDYAHRLTAEHDLAITSAIDMLLSGV